MVSKSELKKKYKELVRKGKEKEARAILKKIWGIESSGSKRKKTSKKVKYKSIDSLTEIKGIGNKTVKDLKRIAKNLSSLKKLLEKDKVPLRDDIVEILKRELL